jgi:hypothetical protein
MDIEKLESILLKKEFSELSPAEKEMVFAEVGTESDYEHLRETLLRVKTTFTAEASSVSASDDFKDVLLRRFETSRPTQKTWYNRVLEHVSEHLKVYSLAGSMAILLLIFLIYNNTLNDNLTPEIAKVENINKTSTSPANDYKPDENDAITRNVAGKANEENQIKSIQPETKKVPLENNLPNEPHLNKSAARINDSHASINASDDILNQGTKIAEARDEYHNNNLEESRSRQDQNAIADKPNKDNSSKKQKAVTEKQQNEGKIFVSKPQAAAPSGVTTMATAVEDNEQTQRFPVFQECSQTLDEAYSEKCFQDNLYKYLNKKIKIDEEESQNLSGKIKVVLTINNRGEVGDVKFINRTNQNLEKKLREALKAIPDFKKTKAEGKINTYEIIIDLGRLK